MPKTYSSLPGVERFRTVPCPLCGADEPVPFLSCDGFSFVRCVACRAVYQRPTPVFEDLRKRYGEGYFVYEHENERNFFNLMKLGLSDVDFEARTGDLPNPRTFLDIGCATGMLLASMRDKGWVVKGVDVCRESAEYGRRHRGVDIFPGTLEEAGFPDESFSVIHFSHLIEHVPDPRGFLVEVRRILKKDGLAVITTPNVDGFQARLFGSGWRSAIADHLVLFSRRTLGRLLRDSGFEILTTVTWGGLAMGTAPRLVKRPIDRLAKKLGFGDVVLFLTEKRAA
ncbi:MAG TPA: class I SAM-dependent methyltransferase [Spirochaetia bacterium]|nr:class I SAM-dependent methyltransferase [Spirochaetia bacterium]